jgi:hypothetical protein
MVTCAEAIKEAFEDKDQILTTKQIIDSVQKRYPDKWKEVTIRTHTMGCSINHSSSKWYPYFPKFLYTISPGNFRLYNPEKDGSPTSFNQETVQDNDENITEEDAFEFTFSFEKDLQEHISHDLSKIEPGLTLYTEEGLSGREISTEAGKIDILAKDNDNNLVIIELKSSRAPHSSLAQVLGYMASIKNEFNVKNIRGIIIAEDFDKKLKMAVSLIPIVTLMKYKVKFDFEKIA